MFLKQLYNFNKFLFYFLILFILGSSLVFYKWGAVATPIYQYGMFCQKFHQSDTQSVYQFYINSKPINYSNYNQHDMDLTQEIVANYLKQKKTNPEIFKTMNGFYTKVGLRNFLCEERFLNLKSDKEFIIWLAKIIPQAATANPINLSLEQHNYVYKNKQFIKLNSLKIIDSLAFVN